MSTLKYQEIISLRDITDAQRRGYLFETAIREVLPWTTRPPLAMVGESEQIDAFFEWNSWHFIVEAKAKKAPIKRGSHDWEDFELKVRKRRGSCIGLFCSLFPVSDHLYSAAEELNREGLCTLVLAGDVWDELEQLMVPFDGILRYSVLIARSRFKATPAPIADAVKWLRDIKTTEQRVGTISRAASMPFLRRFAHPSHEKIYVQREADRYLFSLAEQLKPSVLARHTKTKRKGTTELIQTVELPPQVVLIRDTSGAGKTTLAVNLALITRGFVGITRAALDPEFDDIVHALAPIAEAEDCGLNALVTLDLPVFYTVDSLDEAMRNPTLNAQIHNLFKTLEQLNALAQNRGYRGFPVCIVFTVREDYWRYFQAQFDGRRIRSFVNTFSLFTQDEYQEALGRYLSVYEVTLDGELPKNAYSVLATPFNMQVFAEAYQYCCVSFDDDILMEDIVGVYFRKKRESAVKHQIPGFTDRAFMQALCTIAFGCINRQSARPLQSQIVEDLEANLHLASWVVDDILLHLRSEQILRLESGVYSFRHMRFLEYLVAFFVVSEAAHRGDGSMLEDRTKTITDSGVVSIVRVHDFIGHVVRHEFPEVEQVISGYYARSEKFLRPFLTSMRHHIASSGSCGKESLQMVAISVAMDDPEISWDAFHVIAARKNKASEKQLLDAFEKAWERNRYRNDRWKLLSRLADRGCLCHERVFVRILESEGPKDWEVFLGNVLESDRGPAEDLWRHFDAGTAVRRRIREEKDDWKAVAYLIECLEKRKEFIKGEAL